MGGGRSLTSVIEPAHSRGYICWNSIPNVKYEVKLLQKDSLGNYYQVGQKTTTNNYARLLKENYTDTEGLYYSIVAYDASNGSVVNESDIQTYIIDGGYSNVLCERDCNGSAYAWNLKIRESNNYGNTVMTFGSALKYYDQVNDMAVYYYQAMSDDTYNSLPPNHPYYGINTTYGIYQTMDITEAISLGIAGPFYSASNTLITSGKLIEKKMNQFQYMSGHDALGNPDETMCLVNNVTTGGSWMHYYNNNMPQITAPVSVEPFAYTVPTQLECDGGGNGSGGVPDSSLTPNDLLNNNNLNSDTTYTFCCWPTLCDFLTAIGADCEQGVIDNFDNPIQGIIIEQFNLPSPSSYPFDFKNTTADFSSIQNLPTGLYRINVFGYNGEAFPFYVEHINPDYRPQEKDYVTLTLLPTLIENDQLNLSISSEINIIATVQVQSLDGTIHYTEVVNLKSTIDRPLNITINTSNIPYNQLKVNLIFNDGSIIQKTAVKIN